MIIEYPSINAMATHVGISPGKEELDFLIYGYHMEKDLNYSGLSHYKQQFYEISIDFAGICKFTIDNEEIPSVSNRIVYINPNRQIEISLENKLAGGLKGYSIFFTEEFINNSYYKTLFRAKLEAIDLVNQVTPAEMRSYQNIVEDIFYEYTHFNPLSSALIITRYMEILLLKLVHRRNIPGEVPVWKQTAAQKITGDFLNLAAEKFILKKPLAFYASHLKITQGHLTETVKMQTGKTPSRILNELRIEYSKQLLRQGEKSIKEISLELMFDDANNFSTYFKKYTGDSPTDFRELNS